MKINPTHRRARTALGFAAIAAFGGATLVGCTQAVATLPARPATAAARRPLVTHRVLHSFGATAGDGEMPLAGLTLANGLLYGTTYAGGASGHGAVYALNARDEERVVFSFPGGAEGAHPAAGLIEVHGALVGTTRSGGGAAACPAGCGSVIEVQADGSARALYDFRGGTDGAFPRGNLVEVNGNLYGTTTAGGDAGLGTVFELEPSGVERIIHSFNGGSSDGAYPEAGLVVMNGALYGTTRFGGPSRDCASIGPGFEGCGVVFAVELFSGAERVVHAFTGEADGAKPSGDLLAFDDALYGVTEHGGTGTRCGIGKPGGCGTVFEIRRDRPERILYSFAGGNDGATPVGGLIAANGTLYGTTTAGGTGSACGGGCGTVFALSPLGVKRVLYNFGGLANGGRPTGELRDVNGSLYGTTREGGTSGKGTVFVVTP